jgi:hypothetical protein
VFFTRPDCFHRTQYGRAVHRFYLPQVQSPPAWHPQEQELPQSCFTASVFLQEPSFWQHSDFWASCFLQHSHPLSQVLPAQQLHCLQPQSLQQSHAAFFAHSHFAAVQWQSLHSHAGPQGHEAFGASAVCNAEGANIVEIKNIMVNMVISFGINVIFETQ